MTVLGWVFVWFELLGGESNFAGSTLIDLIVTAVEWQSISPLWSWPGIIFSRYFHEQPLSLSKDILLDVRLAAGAQCHILCCQQHLLTSTALDSLPGDYYLGETQDEAKKRKRVSSADDKRLRFVLVAVAEKYPDSSSIPLQSHMLRILQTGKPSQAPFPRSAWAAPQDFGVSRLQFMLETLESS